jgi:hypothetical protein
MDARFLSKLTEITEKVDQIAKRFKMLDWIAIFLSIDRQLIKDKCIFLNTIRIEKNII